MTALVEALRSASAPLLWLDDTAYTERLLGGGHTPWLDSAEYVAFRRKAHGLLRADLRAVPLMGFLRAWAAAHPALTDAMAAKSRAVYPVRTLLADEGLRAQLVETLSGLRAAFGDASLVLGLPSPRAMVTAAWQMAHGADAAVEVGADEGDSCAVDLAEFLRSFEGCKVDALLLEEPAGAPAMNAETLEWYQPVLNVASHYRWDVGLRLPDDVVFEGDADAVQFAIGARAIGGAVHVSCLSEAFWAGQMPAPVGPGQHHFATVPADAVPETVLARLSALRGT